MALKYDLNSIFADLEKQVKNISIFPATHFVTSKEKLQEAIRRIQEELEKQLRKY